MRRTFALLTLLAMVATCSRRTTVLSDSSPAHLDPNSTSVFGDWVLSTNPDSTAFVGARQVALTLSPSAFTIRAFYGSSGAPMVISGTTNVVSGTGMLTLTPQTVVQGASMNSRVGLVPGQPITVVASAAGGAMLFASPNDGPVAIPSSVWHRMEAARAAGLLGPATIQAASRDSL